MQLALLDWIWLGRPSIAPSRLHLGSKLKPRQWEVVRLLENLSEDGNSRTSVDAVSMGRVAAKVENSDRELAALHRAAAFLTGGGSNTCFQRSGTFGDELSQMEIEHKFGMFEGHIKDEPFVAAKPVEADRLTFVGEPRFDPSKLF